MAADRDGEESEDGVLLALPQPGTAEDCSPPWPCVQGDKGGGAAGAQECNFILDQVQRGTLSAVLLGHSSLSGEAGEGA